jgi:iron(III) transport system substrate-binding protein
MDLTKPENDKMTGQVFARSGGTTWTRVMFERQVLGEDYWAKQASTHPILYPSGAPMSDSLVRGEVAMGPLLYNAIYPKQKDGAPIKIFFPPEGAPVNPYATGIPKTRRQSQCRKAVPELVPVEGGANLHDQGTRQSDLAQGGAGLSRGLRSQGGQGLVSEVR